MPDLKMHQIKKNSFALFRQGALTVLAWLLGSMPFIARAGSTETLGGIINTAIDIVTTAVPFVLLLLLFFWSMWQVIANAGDAEKLKKARTRILWGIIALFVVFSLGGLIAVLRATLFPSGTLDG